MNVRASPSPEMQVRSSCRQKPDSWGTRIDPQACDGVLSVTGAAGVHTSRKSGVDKWLHGQKGYDSKHSEVKNSNQETGVKSPKLSVALLYSFNQTEQKK